MIVYYFFLPRTRPKKNFNTISILNYVFYDLNLKTVIKYASFAII